MAINFSQVKTITIPEGSVKKITDSNGVVLWKEQSAEWHTLWEGNVTNYNEPSEITVATLSDLNGTVTLRVTWSCSISGGNSIPTKYYNNNGWAATTTTKPDSPFQFDLNADSSYRDYIVGINKLSNGVGRNCRFKWNKWNKSFTLSGSIGQYNDGGVNLSMTVTKIEQYY